MIGTTIGGYRILEKIGEGGMGVVYKAVDVSLDRVVALKALTTELAKNPELEQRFRIEAKAQASLNHVNLATLYAFLVEGGAAWMVMEYIEGESFAAMIQRRGPIPSQEALPLFRQALLGLGYAHRMGIVHRDIKPGNMMLNRQGIVKVMDFGLAKVLGGRSMTRTGTQMGTAWYMAPEQVLNRGVDIRSDIYALGVTLYEMVSGRVPFESDSDYEVMTAHVQTPPPPPTQFYPYIPAGVVNAALKALAKDPNERFQTTEEFGAALEQPDTFRWAPAAAVGATVLTPPGGVGAARVTQAPGVPAAAPPPPPAAARPFWTVPRLALLGVGAIALAGAAAYLDLHPDLFHRDHKTPATPITSNTGGGSGSGGGGGMIEIPMGGGGGQGTQGGGTGGGQQTSNQEQQKQGGGGQGAPKHSPTPVYRATPVPVQPVVAQAVTIPAGTAIGVRTMGAIDSSKSQAGQRYPASLDAAVLAGGTEVAPRGANVQLEVVQAADSGHLKGRAVIELRLAVIEVRGRRVAVASDTILQQGSQRAGAAGAVVGGAAVVGGVVGGFLHHKRGAAEGAAVGGGAGVAVDETTRNRVAIPAETVLVFHLRAAVTVE